MRRMGRGLVPATLVTAALAFAGCKSEPLGPSGRQPTAGSTGTSGTIATTGAGGGSGPGGAAGGSGPGGAGGFAGSLGGDGFSGGSAGAGGCLESKFESTVSAPDILIVLNRSAAMGRGADGQSCSTPGCTKWEQLVAAVDAVVAATPSYNYGLMYFGNTMVCDVPRNPMVGVGPGGAANIPGEIGLVSLTGAAPVAGTIQSAEAYLRGLSDGSSKYILLATDGAPTCGAGDAGATTDDASGAEAAIAAAAHWGIETFVLGVADPADTNAVSTLNAMATAGEAQEIVTPTTYYDATTGVTALEQVLSGLLPGFDCTTPIRTPIGAPPGGSLFVTITRDNLTKNVPYDPTGVAGWSYSSTDPLDIVLNGPYCSALDALGETTVDVKFDCTPPLGNVH